MKQEKLFDRFPILEGSRVILKETGMKDHPMMTDLFERHLSKKYTVMLVEGFRRKFLQKESLVLGVYEKDTGHLAGVIEAYDRTADGSVQIGYRTSLPFRNKGYTKDAVWLFAAWLMSLPDVPYLRAVTGKENTASQKILTGCGFRKQAETENEYIYTYGRNVHEE